MKDIMGNSKMILSMNKKYSMTYLDKYICGKDLPEDSTLSTASLTQQKQTTNEENSISAWIFRYRQLPGGYSLERVS